MLDEEGLGDHGSGAAGADQPSDGGQQIEEEDGQVAHGLGIVPTLSPLASLGISGGLWHRLRIGHPQVPAQPACEPVPYFSIHFLDRS